MEVFGFWPTAGIGMLGGLIAEAIRIGSAFRDGKPPKGAEYIGSLIYVILGLGILFYGWDRPRSAFEAATLGAAFPSVFAAAVRTVKAPSAGPAEQAAAEQAAAEQAAADEPEAERDARPAREPAAPGATRRTFGDYMASYF